MKFILMDTKAFGVTKVKSKFPMEVIKHFLHHEMTAISSSTSNHPILVQNMRLLFLMEVLVTQRS